jgi:hypothetical protein
LSFCTKGFESTFGFEGGLRDGAWTGTLCGYWFVSGTSNPPVPGFHLPPISGVLCNSFLNIHFPGFPRTLPSDTSTVISLLVLPKVNSTFKALATKNTSGGQFSSVTSIYILVTQVLLGNMAFESIGWENHYSPQNFSFR